MTRRIFLVSDTFHRADQFITMMNDHPQRRRLDFVTITNEDRLVEIPHSADVWIVEPMHNIGLRASAEQRINSRACKMDVVNCDGCTVLGHFVG